MSKTAKTRPVNVRMNDCADRLVPRIEVHDHRAGMCTLLPPGSSGNDRHGPGCRFAVDGRSAARRRPRGAHQRRVREIRHERRVTRSALRLARTEPVTSD